MPPDSEALVLCLYNDIIDVVVANSYNFNSHLPVIDYEGHRYKKIQEGIDILQEGLSKSLTKVELDNSVTEFLIGYIDYVEWFVITWWSKVVISRDFFGSPMKVTEVEFTNTTLNITVSNNE